MNALWALIAFLFIGGQVLSFTLDGSSGVASTTLSSDISADALYIPISDNTGFPASDSRLFIDVEEMAYDSIQTSSDSNCSSPPCLVLSSGNRGINDTDAVKHFSGARVYTEVAGLVNAANSFSINQLSSGNTFVDVFVVPIQVTGAIFGFVAKAVMWDYAFLDGNGFYIKLMLLYPLSMAFIIAVIAWVRNTVSP